MLMWLWFVSILLIGAGGVKGPFQDVLSGQDVRLCAAEYAPSLMTVKAKNGTVISRRGLIVDSFVYLARALNITYSFVELNEEDVLKYGWFQACTNAIIADKLDVTYPVSLSPAAYQVMDVVNSPVAVQQLRFTVRYPDEESRIFALYRPFRPVLWIWVLVLTVVTPFAFHWLSVGYHRFVDPTCPTESVSDYAVYLATILLYQGNQSRLKQLSFRLATGLFGLAAVILVNAYASKMTADLSVPKLQPIINSLQEMVDSPRLKLMMDIKSPVGQMFRAAENGTFKRVGDLLRKDNMVDSYESGKVQEAILKLKSGRTALLQIDAVSFPIIQNTYKAAGKKCLFTVSKPIGIQLTYHFYTVKNGVYTDPINKKWFNIWDTGIRHVNDYQPNIDSCLLEHHRSATNDKKKPLSLKDLTGAFTLLGLGLSLSLLAYVVELCFFSVVQP